MKEEKVVDAMRGVLWEEKFRGDISQLSEEEYHKIRSQALNKLSLYKYLLPNKSLKGSWPLGKVGLGTYKYKYNEELIEKSLELGCPIIDTAEGYGFGKVEKSIGKVLNHQETNTWIATKFARNRLSYSAVLSAGYRSRDNLRVSILDLYQIHWPILNHLPTQMDALAKLLGDKVVKRVGVSNFCGYQLLLAQSLAKERGFSLASNQIRFNYEDRGSGNYLIPLCKSLNIKIIAYSPLGQGNLSTSVSSGLIWIRRNHPDLVLIPATNKVEHLISNLKFG